MNNKGFTLIELLSAIFIIGLLAGIAVVSYRAIFKSSEQQYYKTIESNMMLAGNEYFTDHRELIPTGENYNSVSLTELVSSRYMEQVFDSNGIACNDGNVYAYRDNNHLMYEACLNNCGDYVSTGKYCSGEIKTKEIDITAKIKNAANGEDYYNPLVSYNSVKTAKDAVIVNFKMVENYSVAYYSAVNLQTEYEKSCNVVSSDGCTIEIDKSGTYKVTSYDSDDKEISTRYFSIRIAKGDNPMVVITPQRWETPFSSSSQTFDFTPVDGAKGTVKYEIISQKKENYNVNYFSIENDIVNNIKMQASTPCGVYNVKIKVTALGDEQYEQAEDEIDLLVKVMRLDEYVIELANRTSCQSKWVDDMETTDPTDDITYFSGVSSCIDFNYLWYSGKLWRIVSIYPDGAMKLVTDHLMTGIAYNSANNPIFYTDSNNQSYIYQWLNQDFLATLYNHQNIIDTTKKWNITNSNATSRDDINQRLPNTTLVEAKVGLLNSYEYYNSFRCANKSSCDGTSSSSGYLNLNYYHWLLNPYSDTHAWQVFSAAVEPGENYVRSYYRNAGVRPSIVIKPNLEFSGNGTISTPFKLAIDKKVGNLGELINTRISGEYVKFSNSDDADIFRIVGIENGKTKIVMNNYFENKVKKPFAVDSTVSDSAYWGKGSTTSEGTWYYYLTNVYLPSLKNQYGNIFDSGTYYTSIVNSSVDYNYKVAICENPTLESTSTCAKTTNADDFEIGVLRYGEMHAEVQEKKVSNDIGVAMILITPYDTRYAWHVGNNAHLYGASLTFGTNPSDLNGPGAKPTLHLKSTVKIKGGSGTLLDPYIVGL